MPEFPKANPKSWQTLKRHELSAEYVDITDAAWQRFLTNLDENGIIGDRKITLFEGKVLDGWQLYRACVALVKKPKFQQLPKGMSPDVFIAAMHEHRRHETPESLKAHAAKRKARVIAARASGKSTRAIAEELGVSQPTVLRDLAKPGDTPVSPETKASGAGGGAPEGAASGVSGDTPEKVTGKDGKTYAATKPKAGKIKPTTKADELLDGVGNVIPAHLRDVFGDTWIRKGRALVLTAEDAYQKARQIRLQAAKGPDYPFMRASEINDKIDNIGEWYKLIILALDSGEPYAVCPACKGKLKGCSECRRSGYVPEYKYKEMTTGVG